MNPVCGCETNPTSDRQVIALPWFTVFECTGCGLWYIDKLLQPSSIDDLLHFHQSERYVSAFAPGYLDSPPSRAETFLFNNVISLARALYSNPSSLLDAGCGGGRFLQFMKHNGNWKVLCGLELSPLLAQKTQEKGLDVVIGDMQHSSFRDGSFDIVTMWDVIEHLARPIKALEEIHRVLSPTGILIIATPNAGSILHLLSLWMYRLGIEGLQKPARRVFAGHPLYFTLSSLSTLLARSGFLIRAVWQYSVSSEASRREEWIERLAQILDASLGRILRRRYRMVIVAQKGE